MSAPTHRIQKEEEVQASTTSIASTPVAACAVIPTSGWIQRVFAAAAGTTTGTITVSVAINNGSDICNSLLLIPPGSNARSGNSIEFAYSAATVGTNQVFEGDVVTFSPTGGTGSSIGGSFGLIVRKGTG